MKKSRDLVKYHNDLNKLNMSSLKEKELEFFYAICLELKEKGNSEIKLNINDFKKEFNISNKIDKKRFGDYIESVHNKFLEIKTTKRTDFIIESMNFFKKFKTNLDTGIMEIQVNEEFTYFLNKLAKLYTRFSFLEFQSLNGKYAKLLMPHLMQWDSEKEISYTKEELFDIFGLNKNYRKDLSNFNRKILNPTIKELTNIFYNLHCEKIKKGREIFKYNFKWESIEKLEEICKEEKKVISPGSSFAEFWRNNFLGVNYTSKHQEVIENLLKKYSESYLKNYLLEQWEYVKNNNSINNKAAYFSSLILNGKSAPKDYESLNRPISKKEDKEQAETFINTFFQDLNQVEENNYTEDDFEQANLFEEKTVKKEKEIREVTSEEYEEEYQKHLIELNIKDSEFQRKIFAKHSGLKIKAKKIYTEEDIPEEKLLSKNGRKLVGSALKMRVDKILKEMNQD